MKKNNDALVAAARQLRAAFERTFEPLKKDTEVSPVVDAIRGYVLAIVEHESPTLVRVVRELVKEEIALAACSAPRYDIHVAFADGVDPMRVVEVFRRDLERVGGRVVEEAKNAPSKLEQELCDVLMQFVGETGKSEGAVEVLRRLVSEVGVVRNMMKSAKAFGAPFPVISVDILEASIRLARLEGQA
jgi:hypothetical protein